VLYDFSNKKEQDPTGAEPASGLLDIDGTFYGTTIEGVDGGYGAVFSVTPSGKANLIYAFKGPPSDGEMPMAGLIEVNGALYGTTFNGGRSDNGIVFKISLPSGIETVLYSFKGRPDGAMPRAGLTEVNGMLYGTTITAGANGLGAVFKITTSGHESVLYSFKSNAIDGYTPYAGLVNVKGTLFGTTLVGGIAGNGTVFKVTTSGKEKPIYSFQDAPDGAKPYAGLIEVNGALYGTTVGGGTYGEGSVFTVTTSGKTERVLHSFVMSKKDGIQPVASLLELKDSLYGTTTLGGTYSEGTIFKIPTAGGSDCVVHSFGAYLDGIEPQAGLTNVAGTLYGTTEFGGTGSGDGTVFSLAADGC
jgi:uncharacterized repeat protein (TIGR03803 family)